MEISALEERELTERSYRYWTEKLDDYMYFQIDYEWGYHPYIAPDDVYEIWQTEFDMARQEGTVFILTMHPQVIGHRSRIVILERLIEYMRGHDARFATLGEIARYVKAH